MNDNSVRFECHGRTAVVTLDSPATRNAFTPAVREGLAQAIATVRADHDIRALVLTGAGGHFCAGGDLRGIASTELDGAGWRERMHKVQAWVRDLITLDRPVIAAVDGAAYGAGFGLALAADFVLATPRVRFCLSFLKIGLVPDCGVFYTLPRVVGAQRARELMLSAREVGAAEARELGIAMELHEPDRLMPRALALAATFANASPLAVSLIKRALTDPGALDGLLDTEANAQALAFGTTEHREAVRRFLDKQPPAFDWPGNS
jgi:2-(1,2-epoxy-1,2-dihydrophenyl)acetyl-CoA isomerase